MAQVRVQHLFKKVIILDLFLFIFLAIFSGLNSYFPVDLSITRLIQGISNSPFDSTMRFLSAIGEPRISLSLLIFSSLSLYLFKQKKDALMIIFSGFGLTILTEVIKFIVHRPRPSPLLINLSLPKLNSGSFPSWHVLIFIALLGYWLIITHKKITGGLFRKVLETLFILLILLMGVSRIYLGAHWFSDVLGSLLLGFAWLSLTLKLYQSI